MELDDLKTVWNSVEPEIESFTQQEKIVIKKRTDIKTKLVRKMYCAASCTFIGFVLMSTSLLWAPIKLHLPLIITICTILFIGFLSEIYLARTISCINLWNDSNESVVTAILKIQKTYKRMELWFSVLIALSIFWMTTTPPFRGTVRPVIAWILLAIALILEYLWYRKNLKKLNELSD